MRQSRMDNLEINATLGTRHRTKTNKAKVQNKYKKQTKQKLTKYTKAKH
jgi:hypothetical protein